MKFLLTLCFVIIFISKQSFAEDACTLTIQNSNLVANVNTDKVFLIHNINGQQPVKYTLTTAASTIPNSQFFVKTSPMIILIHGYAAVTQTDFKPTIAALKTKNQPNIFELDYNEYAKNLNYAQVVVDARKVSEHLATALSVMKDNGVVGFHLIGHSIGAHMGGLVGKKYKTLKSSLLNRVTGLDPAGPCFINEAADQRLAPTDASFVDVIHTDIQLGMLKSIGQVDFYPNGGDNMPGIFNVDHEMCVKYFTESITNNNFLSVVCADWNTFKAGSCKTNPTVPMGYWTPTTTTGNRYLRTRASPLYALGTSGLT